MPLLKQIFSGIWRLVTVVADGVRALFSLAIVVVLIVALFGSSDSELQSIPERGALWVNPVGSFTEDRRIAEPAEALFGDSEQQLILGAVVKSIEMAADDERISAVVLDLGGLSAVSVSQGSEINAALAQVKAAGKPIIAIADFYSQGQYLIASQADSVYLHPQGDVGIVGFSTYRSYIRQLLDNILVTMHVFRVGENKSAVEPFLRDDMSDHEREVVTRWVNGLWTQYASAIESARNLPPGALQALIDDFPERLEAAQGNMAALMVEAGLVDELLNRELLQARMAKHVGAVDDEGEWVRIDVQQYFEQAMMERDLARLADADLPVIAIVPVEGELVPGESSPGLAGSDTIVEQIREAEAIDNVAAIVLRVNSPGGSVFASELIREEVLRVKASGLPVVVSMASVAASGGYYIAADADQIWAQPSTITGSIGVFAAFPTLERLYAFAGVNVDGVATSDLASSMVAGRPLGQDAARMITAMIGRIYRDFTALVAAGRGMTIEQVESVAGGKVWVGQDALEIGLIDALGGLNEAVAAAAAMGEASSWTVRRVGTPLSPELLLLEELGDFIAINHSRNQSLMSQWLAAVVEPVKMMNHLRDPRDLYLRCLSCSSQL